jgi:tRNA-dihydrouridine synthase B
MPVELLERPESLVESPAPRAYHVGDICISPPVVLAPMADVTNGAYRRLVKRIAAPGLLVTELISTMAMHYNSKRTFTMFDVTPEQHPLAVQLFGSDPQIMANAAKVAVSEGADIIDINMGCWVPKVCKTGAGAAMMKDEDTACRVVGAIIEAVAPTPVTVKMRAGWNYGHLATAGLARKLEKLGVAAFALHGRFAVQGHSGDADWNLIREMKQAIGVPLVGNGDIKKPEDALRMFAETGCDGVMIGRAAIGNPWIVRDVVSLVMNGTIPPPPTLDERIEAALSHVCDLAQVLGEERAVRHLRGQLPLYVSGFPGAARVREAITRTVSITEVQATFDAYRARLSQTSLDPQ